ncbi:MULTISPECIES: DnaD domain protein [Streptococcus]|uniref:Phage replication protein n=1 Tax=Streptococcus pseudopneumoniae TaxID=257758 RepID=A0A0U0CM36_9STRE|nr:MULTISPECIES: DnaD domain protein [Streptococcus]MDS9311626.1 DnaD domain protein [Streptococcus pseudopneumoniae]NIB82140.1 DnaD domain protein [Streptococcus pseudopneumoniae]NIB89874.1 DnaD domain protein [Streptococcus pseudopneumoniae]PLV82062.1 replisome organizer [Streptococcus pseudopneumoniae]CEY56581.1 Phage replication protein [Streptococcus pseudopneumoniae]
MAKTKIYFWLKIDKKFFDNIFIKRLKTVPGGYTMTVIYIRLMLESLESDCILYYEGYFDNLKEELALKLDVSEDDIDMTMAYFTKCGLIQVDEDKNAELPQAKALVQQETNQAAYMREYRKQQREQKENLTMSSDNLTLLTTCKTEIEIEKELEVEVDKEQSPTPSTLNQDFINIYKSFEAEIGKALSPLQIQDLQYMLEDFSPELIHEALKEAVSQGKANFAYIKAILNRWKQDNLLTVELVRNSFAVREARKQSPKQAEPVNREEWLKTRTEENPF